ncbi:hypothetical protein EJ06DRAFT_502077 [Trichodelitschia bisporula]|uniref:DNA-directed DNA polymerase n=1 Tax=Trichodelitschia bisporula TaxID=703511 RepID=A0A6G1IA21_9PEZI|nr:hypothetical protein EJ06DRAFT_502077 [Trichodelitschia bisporula]
MADQSIYLQDPSDHEFPVSTRVASTYNPLHTFELPKGEEKGYSQQFADMYFLRLVALKPTVEKIAAEAWAEFELAGEKARQVERVLDVRQGELCWMVGTVFMELPLKPNVLDDLVKEHWIAAPPAREKYISYDDKDKAFLEDESGRLRLTGAHLKSHLLVTGCIVAVMGSENAAGEFEVVDIKFPDLPAQPERWARDLGAKKKKPPLCGKLGIVSGLGVNVDSGDTLLHDLLVEYLLGDIPSPADVSQISRLIIVGNSMDHASPIMSREDFDAAKRTKKFGQDIHDPVPSELLDDFLAQLLPTIPITILPGETDPANVTFPQQPLHPALFPTSRAYINPPTENDPTPNWLDSVSNPWEGDVDGWRFLATSGQPIDDVFRYLPGDDRLVMMEHVLRWRNAAPTAPDTLWSYPFQDKDPFVIKECPHVYLVGNQPRFETAIIQGPAGQTVKLISVPKFKETGMLVLLDMETLEAECVKFEVPEPK